MNISGLGGLDMTGYQKPALQSTPRPALPAAAQAPAAQATTGDDTAQDYFLNYMKETPAQRMEDAWLAAHHLTAKDLAAMPPAQREAIMRQMADDIKKETEQKAAAKSKAKTNILV